MSHQDTGPPASGQKIAVIGIGCRFPGATNAEEFWVNLREGVESITFFSREQLRSMHVPAHLLDNPEYVPAQGVLEGGDEFDADFFGVSPKEAGVMDPQHRLVLECAWETFENSGYDPERTGGPVGVFVGGYRNDYFDTVPISNDHTAEFARNLGNDSDYLAARISYKLDLTGPSATVQTACSTSLVAVHLACQALRLGECTLALAGGVTVRAGQPPGYVYQRGGIHSPDGRCRAFDAGAQGTTIGEGIGLVMLKRLEDAINDGDNIRAVILGSATGNDGAERVGFTAPGVQGQSRLVGAALGRAGVHPDSIGYVEAHGTGTAVGDRIEITALTRAFHAAGWRSGRRAIGSVKTNIGHTHAAAGVAGLIKSVLVLENRLIPPTLHFVEPNASIDFERTPFRVNTEVEPLSTGSPGRIGVSSFALGGSGAHLILEEAPQQADESRSGSTEAVTLSARTAPALATLAGKLADHLESHPGLGLSDVAYTSHVGRRSFRHRRVVVAGDAATAAADLREPRATTTLSGECSDKPPPVAFMFPGMGSQYAQMTSRLLESDLTYRSQLQECADALERLCGVDLYGFLYPGWPARTATDEALVATEQAQLALFAVEYSLAQLWMQWGVQPEALIGHSLGEYVAACIAGVFTLNDALRLVHARATLIGQMPRGAMTAVELAEDQVAPLLGARLSLAAVNAPCRCVVAGPEGAVADLERTLAAGGVPTHRLKTAHAFHSKMIEPAARRFRDAVSGVDLKPPRIPYLSNVSGDWIKEFEATDPEYWVRHLCAPVRFHDGVHKLWRKSERLLLEVGPGNALSGLALKTLSERTDEHQRRVLASLPPSGDLPSERSFLLSAAGKLWVAGVPVRWDLRHAGERRRRLPLPTYPFQRQRYGSRTYAHRAEGCEEGTPTDSDVIPPDAAKPVPAATAPRKTDTSTSVAERLNEIWRAVLGIPSIGFHDNFFDLGGDSFLGIQVLSRLREEFHVELAPESIYQAPTLAELSAIVGSR